MKYRTRAYFLVALLMFVSMTFSACDYNSGKETNNNKKYEKLLESTRHLDETYHPTQKQQKELDSLKERSQSRQQDAYSVANKMQQKER